ncbi:uncharacterized protein At4g06744 [Cannabis sativa]|uniref:uncharacterized protein At4g06744 n=1 Tax=Cannabis sativa TaxID=3483 RepID=UPI0029CA4F17|nr:uncharacterized protein At4g06744 [Cannabis sativa]
METNILQNIITRHCLVQTIFFISVILICFPKNNQVICHDNNQAQAPATCSCAPPEIIPEVILSFLDQRLAVVYPIIQTFKNTITSDPFGVTKTWVGSDVCSYTGFYCDNPPDNLTATTVSSIDFNGFNLAAPTLDGFIDQIPDLALFHANTNKFSGIISPKIATLQYLYELDISNNNFGGPFPTVLLAMTGLTFIDLRYNSFTGVVPPQIFQQSVEALFLNNNNFIQIIPESIGSTPTTLLVLANNKFIGPIPRSIGKATSLTEVLLLNNLLTGCVPYEIGFLRNAILFDASNNLLTGPLPCSLGCLENIEVLNFAGNLLYGKVPEVICELGMLNNFSLADNYFTYVGPHCRRLISNGVLDVKNNCIHGAGLSDQRSIEECALFFMKPRSCLHPSWFTFLPCRSNPHDHDHGHDHSAPFKRPALPHHPHSKRKLLSYDALSRHRQIGVN